MRFLLETEHTDLANSIDSMLTRADLPGVVRAWNDGDRGPGLAVWARLADTGVTGLLIDEASGGFGAGALEMVVAVEQLGRHCVPGPVAETVGAVPTLLAATDRTDLLEALAAGALATLSVPDDVPYAADTDVAAHRLLLDGTTLSTGDVVTTHASVDRARTVSVLAPAETIATDLDGTAAFDHGALATAAQLLGLASQMLAMSGAYAITRTQFGRPIGSFQAIKHHLADVAIAVEMARPLVHGAALALDGSVPAGGDASRDVSAAKVATGRAAYLASRVGLQTLGAIGYTEEHDLSLYLTKTRALLTAWGTPALHRERVLRSVTAPVGAP